MFPHRFLPRTAQSRAGAFKASFRALTGLAMLGFGMLATAADAGPVDIPFTRFTLDNGLTVVVHEDHKAPIVAVNIWYHVGSKDERIGKTGFAHLFEHLMFNGSENHRGEFFEPLERVGATDFNGTTWLDRTNYFENVPTTALDLALFLESDRMGHLLGAIDQKVLDEQRGVVQNEKRQDENQPYGRTQEQIQKAIFPAGHPYSWDTIGSMEDLNAASLDDVKEWFKTYYGAANAVVVLAGDIDVETAKKKMQAYFGDIPAGPPLTKRESWIAKRTESTRDVMYDRVPQTRIYRVWNAPAFGSLEADQLDVVANILGGGKNSRLYKTLVYDKQLATNVSVGNQAFELASMFTIEIDVRPGVEEAEVERVLNDELVSFLKKGTSNSELERVKATMEASFIRGLERVGGFGGKSDVLATYQTYLGDAAAYKQTLARYQSATPDALKRVANTWLAEGDYTLEVRPFPEFQAAKSGVDRSKLPEVTKTPDLIFPTVEHATLENGMKVVLAERHSIPTVLVNLQFDAGYAADRGAKLGTASFAMSMLDEGTQSLSALEINDRKQRLGAEIGAGSSLDSSTVALDALKKNLDASLDLFADIVRNPAFDAGEIERLRGRWLASIQQEKAEPMTAALRLLPPLLYGKDHAYGIPFTGSGTEASIAGLKREDLVGFHAHWMRPDNATVLVTGDVTMKEILPKLNRVFGDWRAPAEPKPVKTLAEVKDPAAARVFLIDKPGALQSIIIAGQTIAAPTQDMGRNAALYTMNDILGGQFGARLNMNLREDKHWAYGAYTAMRNARGMRPYFAYAPVQTDKTRESIVEMRKELHDYIGGKPATEAEIEKSVLNTIRSMPGEYETSGAVMSALSNIVTYGRPDNYVEMIKPTYDKLKLAEVQAMAKDTLKPDRMTWVIVGDLAKIEKDVRALNLGEVKVVDADGKPVR